MFALIGFLFILMMGIFITYYEQMLLLRGKEKSEGMKDKLKRLRTQYFGDEKKFVAILFFGESNPSQVYVNLKKKYAKEIGFDCLIFGQGESEVNEEYSDLIEYQRKNYDNRNDVIELVDRLNNDESCVGIICQLPLTEELKLYQREICNYITPLKDIDGLGDRLQKWAFEGKIEFLPATAQAVISLRNSYDLGDFEGKTISVIGQSDIVGGPISRYLDIKGADVHRFDIRNTEEEIIQQTKESDAIITCTGALHLVDDRFVNEEKNQILIDVGYGFLEGKATGDVDFEKVKDKVYAISPVPGGVGPMTVASLFENIFTIWKQKEAIKNLTE